MAVRKPLVEADGEVQTLQSGDSLDVDADTYERQFTPTVTPGQIVYSDSNTTVALAQANAVTTSEIVGVAKEAVTAGQNGPVVHDGVLELTTIQWDAVVTGGVGGLVVGTKYFLDNANAGMYLAAGNLGGIGIGEYVVPVGKAISSTEMLLYKDQRIQR